jgi:hypothetical protein
VLRWKSFDLVSIFFFFLWKKEKEFYYSIFCLVAENM